MTTAQKTLLWLATAIASLSGLAYAGLHYFFFLENSDPFSAYRHPLEPWCLRVHVLSVPVLVFCLGWILESHVLEGLRRRRRRRFSGIVLLALVVLLAGSGYSLPFFAEPRLLTWVHIGSGVLFVAFFLGHVFPRVRPRAAVPDDCIRPAKPAQRSHELISG
jgi:heme A synthase